LAFQSHQHLQKAAAQQATEALKTMSFPWCSVVFIKDAYPDVSLGEMNGEKASQ
jgi:hypothetical protein